jgi:thiol-disulfide isomerase/thioredoxin
VGLRTVLTFLAVVGAAWCAAPAGCARAPESPADRKTTGPARAQATVRTVDPAELAATVAKYRGRAVLVDYWATWCESCMELFPHTVALHRDLASRGLAVISVSFDDPEEEPDVLKFLSAQGAEFENLRADSGASSRSAAAFGIENGAIPFVQLYDRAGKLRKTFPAPIRPERIREAVEQLLAEAAPAG